MGTDLINAWIPSQIKISKLLSVFCWTEISGPFMQKTYLICICHTGLLNIKFQYMVYQDF